MTLLFALALLTACVGDVGEGKARAVVEEVPEAAPARQAGQTYPVDAAQSKIQALGAKVSATHPIVFHTFQGEVAVDGDAVSGVNFEIDVASMEADHPKLTKHLMNEDFLFVDQHPTATFRSSKITAGAETEGFDHTVSGALTIRGQSKHVTFPATITQDAKGVSANAEFAINRQDFGIAYPGRADDLVQDSVVLTISLQAPITES